MLALVTSKLGFHADDGDDDAGWHTIFLFRATELISILFPKLDTLLNAIWLQKQFAILAPGELVLCRIFHRLQNRIEKFRLGEGLLQLAFAESMLLFQPIGDGSQLRLLVQRDGCRRGWQHQG